MYRTARKIVVAVVGGTLALLGLVMFVTPGPGLLVLLAGLTLLATEFVWAAWLLKRVRRHSRELAEKAGVLSPRPPEPQPPPPTPDSPPVAPPPRRQADEPT